MISIRQDLNGTYKPTVDDELFWKDVWFFSPLIVETQAEKDYLFAMQFMLGEEFLALLDGIDENTTHYLPTYIKIDLSLIDQSSVTI